MTGVRPALVQLPRGVQVARAEAARDDAARLVRPGGKGSQLAFAGRVDERLDANVVTVAHPGQQLVERAARCDVGLAGGEDLVRLVLRRLHVGLVERVDPEDVAGDRGRELPPEPLLAELVRVREAHFAALPVRSIGRLARRGHEPLALFAGRLCEQLFGPQSEVRRMGVDADLVAAGLPALAELQAQLEARIPLLQQQRLHHLRRAFEEALERNAHQRRGHHPEQRERRVASADLRLARERRAEPPLLRQLLELGAGVGDRRELGATASGAVPEVLQVRARLDRGARLRGREEEGALEIETALEAPDGGRMRRVENVEGLDRERAPEDLRRERRAAHPEQDEVVELLARRLCEGVQLRDARTDPADDVEPPEPAVLAGAGPERRVVRPDPVDDAAHAAASCARFARIPSSSSSKESANFCTPSASSVATTSS